MAIRTASNRAGVPRSRGAEIVVQIGSRKAAERLRPAIAEARPVPNPHDLGWLGSVEGELQNDSPNKTLDRAAISTVALDADGNVLGGATGYAPASLPPGARQFFKISSSLRAIPFGRIASTLVSVTPSYR